MDHPAIRASAVRKQWLSKLGKLYLGMWPIVTPLVWLSLLQAAIYPARWLVLVLAIHGLAVALLYLTTASTMESEYKANFQ